jgi:hypothetical protein
MCSRERARCVEQERWSDSPSAAVAIQLFLPWAAMAGSFALNLKLDQARSVFRETLKPGRFVAPRKERRS